MTALFFNDPNQVIQQYLSATRRQQPLPTPRPLPVVAQQQAGDNVRTVNLQEVVGAGQNFVQRATGTAPSTSRSRPDTRDAQFGTTDRRNFLNFQNAAPIDAEFTEAELIELERLDLSNPFGSAVEEFNAGTISPEQRQLLINFAESLGLDTGGASIGDDGTINFQDRDTRGAIRNQIADAREQLLERARLQEILTEEQERYVENQDRYNELIRGSEERALEELNLPSLNPVEAIDTLVGEIGEISTRQVTGSLGSQYAAAAAADFYLSDRDQQSGVNRQLEIWENATVADVIQNQIRNGVTEEQVLERMIKDGEILPEVAEIWLDRDRFVAPVGSGITLHPRLSESFYENPDEIAAEFFRLIGVEQNFGNAWALSHIAGGIDPRSLLTQAQLRQLRLAVAAIEE